MVTTRPPKTIVKPTALGPVANTDTKLLIYGLFQKGRVLAQDAKLRASGKCSRAAFELPEPSREEPRVAVHHGASVTHLPKHPLRRFHVVLDAAPLWEG